MLRSTKFNCLVFLVVTAVFSLILFPTPVKADDDNWTARYWNNTTLSGTPVLQRSESQINHLWGDGSPGGVNSGNFSARWTRTIFFEAGNYRFTATMDDGMRVWVDDTLIIDAWYNSQIHSISADVYLGRGDHHVKVEYYEASGEAAAQFFWAPVTGSGAILGWQAEYFNNPSLVGQPILVRSDGQTINFDWGTGRPDADVVNSDQFSVRWTQSLSFSAGRYRFTTTSDDGVRLWVNDVLIIDEWRNQAETPHSAEINLPGGVVPVKMEYYDHQGAAVARLSWTRLGEATDGTTPVPSPAPTPSAAGGWLGQYFNNDNLLGSPAAERVDTAVDFIWGSSSPIPNVVEADNFAVRWVGTPTFNAGRYTFLVSADGGIRLWVNDQLLIDSWIDSYAVKPYGAAITLPGGPATVRLEFLEDKGLAEVHLSWMREGGASTSSATGVAASSATGSVTGAAASSGNLTASLVNARYLNVRSGPGMSFEPFAYLSVWQEVELTGYRDLYANWIQVMLPDGRTGWAAARYLSSSFSFMDLALWTG